jgi:hypothetical protein
MKYPSLKAKTKSRETVGVKLNPESYSDCCPVFLPVFPADVHAFAVVLDWPSFVAQQVTTPTRVLGRVARVGAVSGAQTVELG